MEDARVAVIGAGRADPDVALLHLDMRAKVERDVLDREGQRQPVVLRLQGHPRLGIVELRLDRLDEVLERDRASGRVHGSASPVGWATSRTSSRPAGRSKSVRRRKRGTSLSTTSPSPSPSNMVSTGSESAIPVARRPTLRSRSPLAPCAPALSSAIVSPRGRLGA